MRFNPRSEQAEWAKYIALVTRVSSESSRSRSFQPHSPPMPSLVRFQQEARVLSALNHPNLLSIFDVGNQDSSYYLVCELLEGETLRKRLKSGPLALRKAVDYGIQIANGLGAAHEKGIVHRDLKPDNIFITKDSRVRVLDFGLAKSTTARGENTTTIASPATVPGRGNGICRIHVTGAGVWKDG